MTRRLACLLTFLSCGLATAGSTDSAAVSKQIDGAIAARLAREKVKPAPPAGDARLVRRLYLDLLGRVPTTAEVEAFLGDKSPDKVHKLIDRLLVHPEMPVYWRRVIDGWLNGGTNPRERPFGHEDFLAWLGRSLAENKPWDRLARELLDTDPSDPKQNGAGYFLGSRLQQGDNKMEQLDNVATSVASGLFGVQLQCAKCHNHPFVDEWKQDHYYGLAAFFVRLEVKNDKGRHVFNERPSGELKFTTRRKEEKTAQALFLDGTVLNTGKEKAPVNRRRLLADHAFKPDSPYFKRSLVNRVWKQLMGRGLVEPVDQIHAANPASHPELLTALADDFARNGFDLRRLLAGILHSEAYLHDSRYPEGKLPPDHLYAHALLKPLTGEQVAWALQVATGNTDQLAARYSKDLKPAPAKGEITPALRTRWEREREFGEIVDKFRSDGEQFQAHATQALFVTFNGVAQKLLQPAQGNLVARLIAEKDDEKAVRLAFLAVLSRPPQPEEARDVVAFLAASADRKQGCADLVWALLTSAEFRFNH